MGEYIKGFGKAAGHFFSRMWFAAVSFTSGTGLVLRVLGALVVMFSLPISIPMILLAGVVVGVVNARKQSQQLKQRDAAIDELNKLIPTLEASLLEKTESYQALRAELVCNRDLISSHLTQLEKMALLKAKSHALKDAIETHLRYLHRTGDEGTTLYQELNQIVNPNPENSKQIEHAVNQLTAFTEKHHIAVDLNNIPKPKFNVDVNIAKSIKIPDLVQQKPSHWQRFKLGLKKAWGPISFGLGSGMLLMLTLHGIGTLLAVPTGGLSLLINVAASAAFAVGSGILYTAYQSPHNKMHATLTDKKSKLEERTMIVEEKSKRADKKNQVALREVKNYELLVENTVKDIHHNFDGLAKDIHVHTEQPAPTHQKPAPVVEAPKPKPKPETLDSALEKAITDLGDDEKMQLLEKLKDAKRPTLRPHP